MWSPRFASNQSFLTPSLTEDGKPYGPYRYEEIMREYYYISKYTHTTYNDVLMMSPSERQLMLRNIVEDMKHQNEQISKSLASKKK